MTVDGLARQALQFVLAAHSGPRVCVGSADMLPSRDARTPQGKCGICRFMFEAIKKSGKRYLCRPHLSDWGKWRDRARSDRRAAYHFGISRMRPNIVNGASLFDRAPTLSEAS